MPAPTEIAFEGLLFGGVVTSVVLVLALILFVVGYQRKLLAQQVQLLHLQSAQQHQMLLTSIQVQEAERSRIGHDLHDEVGSTLATIKLLVGQAERSSDPHAQRELLRNARELLSATTTDIRNISHNLYPAVLGRFGLWEALHQLADTLMAASEVRVTLALHTSRRLPPTQELALYRMVQELMANALRHGASTELHLEVTDVADALVLTVHDNGRGFDYSARQADIAVGIGLRGVAARANMLRATLHIESVPGQGACVTVSLPHLTETHPA